MVGRKECRARECWSRRQEEKPAREGGGARRDRAAATGHGGASELRSPGSGELIGLVSSSSCIWLGRAMDMGSSLAQSLQPRLFLLISRRTVGAGPHPTGRGSRSRPGVFRSVLGTRRERETGKEGRVELGLVCSCREEEILRCYCCTLEAWVACKRPWHSARLHDCGVRVDTLKSARGWIRRWHQIDIHRGRRTEEGA